MRAKHDGYTLMFGNNNSNVITPILYVKKFTIDYDNDVIPVARLAMFQVLSSQPRRTFRPSPSMNSFRTQSGTRGKSLR